MHNFYLSKFTKKISKEIFQKTQIMHIMHMNNISQKSNFIYKNYLINKICIKSINPEFELLYYIESEI